MKFDRINFTLVLFNMSARVLIFLVLFQIHLCYKKNSQTISVDSANLTKLKDVFRWILTQNSDIYEVKIYDNSSLATSVNEMLRYSQIPRVVTTKNTKRKYQSAPIQFQDNFLFVLFSENVTFVPIIISEGMSLQHLVNRSKILVVLEREVDLVDVENMFKSLWNSAVLNIIVLQLKYDGSVLAFTYNPFKNQSLVKIELNRNAIFYPDKYRNMFGRNLELITFQIVPDTVKIFWKDSWIWLGVAVEMAPLIAAYCNATPVVLMLQNAPYGVELFANESFSYVTGGVALKIQKSKNLITPQRGFTGPSLLFDHTYPFELGMKIILVPKARILPSFLIFFENSKLGVVNLVLISMVVVAVALKISLIILGFRTNVQDLCFKLFATFMSQGNVGLSSVLPVRIIFASWLLFSLILTASLSGEILHSFIVTVYGRDINDPAEALQISHWNFYTFVDYVHILTK